MSFSMGASSFHLGQRLLWRNADVASRPDSFSLFGRSWVLYEGVFAPIYCYSTQLFTNWIAYPRGGRFLEVGCGTGVTAVMAALSGCSHVTAVDVSGASVANTLHNVQLHGVADRIRVLRSDLFDAIPAGERFDMIFWNSNFIDPPDTFSIETDLQRAFFDPGYDTHRRYVCDAPSHLASGGRLLLGFSTLGDAGKLTDIVSSMGRELCLVKESGSSLLTDISYQLLDVREATGDPGAAVGK